MKITQICWICLKILVGWTCRQYFLDVMVVRNIPGKFERPQPRVFVSSLKFLYNKFFLILKSFRIWDPKSGFCREILKNNKVTWNVRNCIRVVLDNIRRIVRQKTFTINVASNSEIFTSLRRFIWFWLIPAPNIVEISHKWLKWLEKSRIWLGLY